MPPWIWERFSNNEVYLRKEKKIPFRMTVLGTPGSVTALPGEAAEPDHIFRNLWNFCSLPRETMGNYYEAEIIAF